MNKSTEITNSTAVAGSDSSVLLCAELPPDGHPLREIGKRLVVLLDDDHWNNCEPYLLETWNEIVALREALMELMKYNDRVVGKYDNFGGYYTVSAGTALLAVLNKCDNALAHNLILKG